MRKMSILAACISLVSIISLFGTLLLTNTGANIQSAQPFTGSQGTIDPELSDIIDTEATITGLKLYKTYRGHYGYVAAGIGVRNTGRGTISLRLPRATRMVHAWLYWMILDNSKSPNPNNKYIDAAGVRIRGTLIGTGPDPCWSGVDKGYTYRAEIKNKLVNTGARTGGQFGITIGGMSSSIILGESPWRASTRAPMAEYVGLVIIYYDAKLPYGTLQIYDGYHEGSGIQSFTYTWPARASGGARFSSLTGDGQKSASPKAKYVDFAGTKLAYGVLSGYDPSITSRATYEGSLADTDTYNVGSLVPMGGGAKTITWAAGSDCISWAALVFHTGTDGPTAP